MLKNALIVIGAYALWTALWLAGNALFFSALHEQARSGARIENTTSLLLVLLLSVLCSVAAGVVCRFAARPKAAAWVTGLLLLITGIGVQASAWSSMPVWYHLVFLALLVPVVLLASGQPKPVAGTHVAASG